MESKRKIAHVARTYGQLLTLFLAVFALGLLIWGKLQLREIPRTAIAVPRAHPPTTGPVRELYLRQRTFTILNACRKVAPRTVRCITGRLVDQRVCNATHVTGRGTRRTAPRYVQWQGPDPGTRN